MAEVDAIKFGTTSYSEGQTTNKTSAGFKKYFDEMAGALSGVPNNAVYNGGAIFNVGAKDGNGAHGIAAG